MPILKEQGESAVCTQLFSCFMCLSLNKEDFCGTDLDYMTSIRLSSERSESLEQQAAHEAVSDIQQKL